jgi:hypothetical protein
MRFADKTTRMSEKLFNTFKPFTAAPLLAQAGIGSTASQINGLLY